MTENEKELLNRGLPKWPRMYVTGISIEPSKALEIIRRTDTFFSGYDGNNRELNEVAKNIVYLPDIYGYKDYWKFEEDKDQWDKQWGLISTEYVDNSWISCCYILGAHGWCHPNGKIGFSTNVGKWPSVEEIYNDWVTIAKEFPFLEIGITLYNGEYCEEDIKPVVSMKVKNGEVTLVDPEKENVHDGHEFESHQDYLESLNITPYIDKKTGVKIEYSMENAIPLELLEQWSKDIFK